jgi:hypothetical protein
MISNNMYVLTKAMQNVFVEPRMVDASTNKSSASFLELNRMEEFWQVDSSNGEQHRTHLFTERCSSVITLV